MSPSSRQRAPNTDQEQHYRQPKQNDAKEENPALEVLFEHTDRPGPMNPLEESDSEAHQLRRNGRQRHKDGGKGDDLGVDRHRLVPTTTMRL